MTPDLPEQGDPADERQWDERYLTDAVYHARVYAAAHALAGNRSGGPTNTDFHGAEAAIDAADAICDGVPLERALRAEEAARDFAALLKRLSQWDMLYCGYPSGPVTADAPYWQDEIARALARNPGFLPTPTEKERG